MPLVHRPGEAQMDFGEAAVKMDGVLRKVMFFAISLPHPGAMYIRAYPRECTETFQEGHIHTFRWFGGVPRSRLHKLKLHTLEQPFERQQVFRAVVHYEYALFLDVRRFLNHVAVRNGPPRGIFPPRTPDSVSLYTRGIRYG